MPEETRQPRPDDAVLGAAPVDLSSAAILGRRAFKESCRSNAA
ncbi:MAG: hypothetical protein WCO81_13955 [Cyanobacteriota bacterium ELA615]